MRRFTPVLLAATLACGDPAPSEPADLVLLGGRVITLDTDSRVAEALAVRGAHVAAVGTDAEIEALAGPATRRIDLSGRAVTPGLMDAHVHFASGGQSMLYTLDLSYPNVESIAEVQAAVAGQAARLGDGEWVRGRGWDEGKLAELRYILASDLDEVVPDRPVWLSHTMGHYGVANSLALDMAGITADTPDPPGGTIDRDAAGRPTGVLKESAQGLVSRLIPGLGPEEQRAGIRALADAFNAECMTGGKDPGIGPRVWEAYRDVQEAGDLSVRIFALWRGRIGTIDEVRGYADSLATFTRPYESTGDDHLMPGGVKLYIDGSGGARTAWLYEDWNRDHTDTDTGNRGYPTMDPDELRRRFRAYHDAGLHVSIHSIGDRGIDWTVDSFREALEANPTPGLRHGIIHSNIPTDRALDLMAELQRDWDTGYPEPSPTFTWWIGDTYAGNFGPERALRLNPFRSYRERGMIWASGSDYSVTPLPGSLWRVGIGRPAAAAGGLRRAALRHCGVGRRRDRAQVLHHLGGPPDVPRGQGGHDRAREVCGPRGVGPRSADRPDRGAPRHDLRDDGVQRGRGVRARRRLTRRPSRAYKTKPPQTQGTLTEPAGA